MLYEKPGGVMHDVLRRALEELRVHNNPYGAINVISVALKNNERASAEKEELKSAATDASGAGLSSSTPPARSYEGGTGANVSVPRLVEAKSADGSASNRSAMVQGHVLSNKTELDPSRALSSAGDVRGGASATDSSAARPKRLFNDTQLLRLLLLRADAYYLTKQHEKALEDAELAVVVSKGQSPEAYFTVGREQRKLFRISESMSAFDTAEALLVSMRTAAASGEDGGGGCLQDTITDEDFWAQRGYQLSDVAKLGVTRREYELQELAKSGSGATSLPSSSWSDRGVLVGVPRASSKDDLTVQRAYVEPLNSPLPHGSNAATRAFSSAESSAVSPSVARPERQDGSGHPDLEDDADAALSGYCGMTTSELSMWRRLAKESRALMAMRLSHTVPTTVHTTTLTLLDRRIASVRGGIVVSIENATASGLCLVGCTAPDAVYHNNFFFSSTVPKGSCGVSMLQPRSWSGFSGAVCYEVEENLSCFCYFESPLIGSVKLGVRFVAIRSADLQAAFAESNGAGPGGIGGLVTPSPLVHTPSSSDGSTTRSGRLAAMRAVRLPNTSVWLSTHTAALGSRTFKATGMLVGNQILSFSIAEVQPVKLRSVELIPALEYVSPSVLKKVSAVSRRYRELVNNLPPPLFYGSTRRSYPDYCLPSDANSSPWIVRDKEAVTWRLTFDGRFGDREDFALADAGDAQHAVLVFSSDSQARVTATVFHGDKRCALAYMKESWVPFSNTLYFVTVLGRTFCSCSPNANGQLTLSLSANAAVGLPEDVLYTARRKVNGSSHPADARGGGSYAAEAPGPLVANHPLSSSENSSQLTSAAAGPAARTDASQQRLAAGADHDSTSSRWSRAAQYTIWRTQHISGASLVNGVAPHTNGGAEIVAEVRVLPWGQHPTSKGLQLAEVKLLPGADALLVSMMMFCIARS